MARQKFHGGDTAIKLCRIPETTIWTIIIAVLGILSYILAWVAIWSETDDYDNKVLRTVSVSCAVVAVILSGIYYYRFTLPDINEALKAAKAAKSAVVPNDDAGDDAGDDDPVDAEQTPILPGRRRMQ